MVIIRNRRTGEELTAAKSRRQALAWMRGAWRRQLDITIEGVFGVECDPRVRVAHRNGLAMECPFEGWWSERFGLEVYDSQQSIVF